MTNNSRILIVDDVIENVRVAMGILKEESYDLSFANNGADALRFLFADTEAFDLVLLDIMMPDIDGYGVCQKLKGNPATADIPVIFLSSKSDVDAITKGFDLGCVDYITKPYHASELLARVKTHLELYRAREMLKKHCLYMQSKATFQRQRLMTELEESQKEMIYILAEVMDATVDETAIHNNRIAESSALMAKYHPALDEDDEETLFHAAPMHDIGKLRTPTEILHKPGALNELEFLILQDHTTNGYELLSRSQRKLLKAAAIIAHEHHEKWDGSGYPRGLKGSEIHIYGRIVALADVFDALTHKRLYKDAWEINDAVNYIIGHRGTQFDPELVDIFGAHQDEFIAIAKSHLVNLPDAV
jgi:putative two-component system response regulator